MKKKYLSFILFFLFIIGCEKIPDSQVDPQNTSIQAVQITAPTDFKFSIFDSSFATSVEFKSVSDLKSVWVNIYSPLDEKVNSEPILLKDDGNFNNGDMQKDDKKYSGKITLGKSNTSGVYQLKYYVTDILDNTQQVGVHSLTYRSTDQNSAPQISELSAPDSIKLSSDTLAIVLTIKASDPDGLDDIKLVYFNSFRPPNGEPSTANPILMFDDGNYENDGDEKAGDGIYTRVIVMYPNTVKGTYRFEFHAIDRFDAESNIITHNLVVY